MNGRCRARAPARPRRRRSPRGVNGRRERMPRPWPRWSRAITRKCSAERGVAGEPVEVGRRRPPVQQDEHRSARRSGQLADERPTPPRQAARAARAAAPAIPLAAARRPTPMPAPPLVWRVETPHHRLAIRLSMLVEHARRPASTRSALWNRPASWNPGAACPGCSPSSGRSRSCGAWPAARPGSRRSPSGSALPKSTVSRLLSTLQDIGAVEQSGPATTTGSASGLVDIAAGALPGRSLVAAARPHLAELVDDAGRGGRALGPRRRGRRLRRPGRQPTTRSRCATGPASGSRRTWSPPASCCSPHIDAADARSLPRLDRWRRPPIARVTDPDQLRSGWPRSPPTGYVWTLRRVRPRGQLGRCAGLRDRWPGCSPPCTSTGRRTGSRPSRRGRPSPGSSSRRRRRIGARLGGADAALAS